MAKKFVGVGVLCLASVVIAGVVGISGEDDKAKEPEKKPNIVRDYVCLREGDLCHPDFARKRGLYVSCSNGLAWEQQCPKCSYHPLNCPTRTLWFDGEKCDWASPKLASQPCIDRFPTNETSSGNTDKASVFSENSFAGSLHISGLPVPMKESVDNTQWQMNPISVSAPIYFKSPKLEEEEPENDINASKEVKAVTENAPVEEETPSSKDETNNKLERKSASELEYPSYVNAEDHLATSKIVKLGEPVYTLVNNPDGSGKQVFVRISQPFVLEDPVGLPNMNIISSHSEKEY